MNHDKAILLILLLTISLFSIPLVETIEAQSSFNWAWDSSFLWKLRKNNTYVTFSDTLYCDSIGYDAFPDNKRWYWINVTMDGDALSEWWIQIENGNITVQSLFKDEIVILNVTGASGTNSTTNLYTGSYGEPVTVYGASSWNHSNQTLTFTVNHQSSQIVTIVFPQRMGAVAESIAYYAIDLLVIGIAVSLIYALTPRDIKDEYPLASSLLIIMFLAVLISLTLDLLPEAI